MPVVLGAAKTVNPELIVELGKIGVVPVALRKPVHGVDTAAPTVRTQPSVVARFRKAIKRTRAKLMAFPKMSVSDVRSIGIGVDAVKVYVFICSVSHSSARTPDVCKTEAKESVFGTLVVDKMPVPT